MRSEHARAVYMRTEPRLGRPPAEHVPTLDGAPTTAIHGAAVSGERQRAAGRGMRLRALIVDVGVAAAPQVPQPEGGIASSAEQPQPVRRRAECCDCAGVRTRELRLGRSGGACCCPPRFATLAALCTVGTRAPRLGAPSECHPTNGAHFARECCVGVVVHVEQREGTGPAHIPHPYATVGSTRRQLVLAARQPRCAAHATRVARESVREAARGEVGEAQRCAATGLISGDRHQRMRGGHGRHRHTAHFRGKVESRHRARRRHTRVPHTHRAVG
mmetsp:Transcript_14226/g.59527  ORF Transcript_14226/g.59527 Transcript_14226/m.59527 type:complete len:274 (+) Transcript_14226:814-1635(+)